MVMKSCLYCKKLQHEPFHYYGGYTGWSEATLKCDIGEIYETDFEPLNLREVFKKAETCGEFDPTS